MIRANFVDVPIKSYTFITFAHDIISCNLQGGINIESTYDMDFIPKSDHKYLQFKVINQ